MKHTRRIAALALVAVLGLTGCGGAPFGGAPGQAGQTAMEQFRADRGGATGTGAAKAQDSSREQPVLGTVERIDGQKIVVKSPMDGASKTVQLGESTKVRKQAVAQLAELRPGETITAFGTKEGDTFVAESIAIGGVLGGGSMTVAPGDAAPNGAPAGNQVLVPGAGAPAAVGGGLVQRNVGVAGGAMPEPLSGTVERVDGQTFVVKSADGTTTTVRLAEKGELHKQVDATIADIQQGQTIMAVVAWKGEVLEARQVDILPPPSQT